jgi:CO dehydrogenase maturation factor
MAKSQPKGRKLVVTGRGGTGKSTFVALAARFLPSPRLFIDADPDESLAFMLGADLEKAGIHTIAQVLLDIKGGNIEREIQSLPLAERIQYLLSIRCLYESEQFDLITLGVKWTRGCYCAPNDALHNIISQIADSYAVTVLDSPAGLEHINRRVTSKADDVFCIMDPSGKSMRNTAAVRSIAAAIGFKYTNLYVVANHSFTDAQYERLKSAEGDACLGRIAADPAVEEAEWEGRSLLDLPASSPAVASVRCILHKAGYDTA